MKNKTVALLLLALAVICAVTAVLWPHRQFDLDGTAKIVLLGNADPIEITDPAVIARITEELEEIRFCKGLFKEGHVRDNHDTYWLSFYDAGGALLAETGHLFVDQDQTCIIGKGFKVWRSNPGHTVDVDFYDQLLGEKE